MTPDDAARSLVIICEDGAWAYFFNEDEESYYEYRRGGPTPPMFCRICKRPYGQGHEPRCRYADMLRAIMGPDAADPAP